MIEIILIRYQLREYLYIHINSDEYLEKIEFKKDQYNILKNYFKENNKLPNGFKRDYAVGLTSYDYIIHLDIDTIYNPKVIKRKLKYIREKNLDCIYCNEMLCYDIYNKELYKTDRSFGYESTLFHTRKCWENNGFQWSDIKDECINFYYNKKLDNYYDSIKILSVHNLNKYSPKKVSLDGIDIKIPEILNEIKIDKHPIYYELNDLFYNKDINVLTLNSKIIDKLKMEKWNIDEIVIEKKMKEKEIIKQINKEYQLCFINLSYPIWKIFDKKIMLLFLRRENIEQMVQY